MRNLLVEKLMSKYGISDEQACFECLAAYDLIHTEGLDPATVIRERWGLVGKGWETDLFLLGDQTS